MKSPHRKSQSSAVRYNQISACLRKPGSPSSTPILRANPKSNVSSHHSPPVMPGPKAISPGLRAIACTCHPLGMTSSFPRPRKQAAARDHPYLLGLSHAWQSGGDERMRMVETTQRLEGFLPSSPREGSVGKWHAFTNIHTQITPASFPG